MKDKQQNAWEKWRGRGKTTFIILIGLAWGIILALLFPLIDLLINDTLDYSAYKASLMSAEGLIRSGVFLFAGLFFGWVLWTIDEKRYKAAQEEI